MLIKTEKERRLLIILGCAIFIIGSFFLFSFLQKKSVELKQEKATLLAESQVAEAWISQQDLWRQRQLWIDENKLVFSKGAQVGFLNEVLGIAEAEEMIVLQQSLFDGRESGHRAMGIRLTLSGSVEGLIKCLYKIQQPEKFVNISQFSCKGIDSSGRIECSLVMAQWFFEQ